MISPDDDGVVEGGVLSDPEVGLLKTVTRYPITEETFKYSFFSRRATDRLISRFLSEGLVEEAPAAQKLDRTHRIADLKPLLVARGLPPKGNKPQMVAALLAAMAEDEVEEVVKNVRAYQATPAGERHIHAFRERQRLKWEALEADLLSLLRAGDLDGALDKLSPFREDPVRDHGMDPSEPLQEDRSTLRAVRLLHHSYSDLPYSEETRREIGVRLALVSIGGGFLREAADHILEVTEGKFSCPALEEFLQAPCGGYARRHKPDNPRHLARLYAHTRSFECGAALTLDDLLTHHGSRFIIGIKILLPKDEPCPMCSPAKLEYRWAEIDGLPRLPRHWGCRCGYVAWTRDWDEYARERWG